MNKISVCAGLPAEICSFCTALFLKASKTEADHRGWDRNGTLTFIEFEGKTYGVTCRHVVKDLDSGEGETKDPLLYAYPTTGNKTRYIENDFTVPAADIPFIQDPPDIAIGELDPDLPGALGKCCYRLSARDRRDLEEIRFGWVVGYPETHRKTALDGRETYERAFCLSAPVRNVSRAGSRIRLVGRLTEDSRKLEDLSGVSGGPVFWSIGETWGLLGIIYGALPGDASNAPARNTSLMGPTKTAFTAERVTPERFAEWIDSLTKNFGKSKVSD